MLSPLTRLLVVSTPLSFAGVLWWLEDESPGLTGAWLGIALSLLMTAIVFIVRNNAVFDDRAFHRTRPAGDARATRCIVVTILALVLSIALLAALRGIILNLGWRANFWSAVILFTLIGWIAFAVATGVTLASGRGGQARRIALVMIGLPILVFLWKHPQGTRRLGGYGSGYETMVIMLWPFVGTVGYALAWWLATARRRWAPALVAAGGVGAALPLLGNVPLWFSSLPELPLSTLTLERLPAGNARARGNLLDIEGQLVAHGLGRDEFIGFERLMPGEPGTRMGEVQVIQVSSGPDRFGPSSSDLWRGILWNRIDPSKSGQVAMIEDLASGLPKPSVLQLTGHQRHQGNWAAYMRLRPTESFSTANIGKAVWFPEGAVYRWEPAGEFPVAEGGWRWLPSGGCLRVRPLGASSSGTSISMRVIRPISLCTESPLKMGTKPDGLQVLSDLPVLFIRDPDTGNVLVPPVSTSREGMGLASEWQNLSAETGYWEMTEEQRAALRRSTVHVFFPRPLARVLAELPPPEPR
jgi:hypothetical protein